MRFMGPDELAEQDGEIVNVLSFAERTEIFQTVLHRFFDSDVLKRQRSWCDRLLNSQFTYPYACLHGRCSDTRRWITQYLQEYWGNKTVLASDSLSPVSNLYEFIHGAYLSKICFDSSLALDEDILVMDRTASFLICFTELDNLLFVDSIVPWVVQKAEDLKMEEELGVIWENPYIVTTVETRYKGHHQRKRQRKGFFSKSASAKPRNVR